MTKAVWGQKIEREERISPAEFPPSALQEVRERFPDARRTRLYREISKADSLTFEAKLRSGGYWYSVEFFPDGQLVDIEKQIKFKALPEAAQALIRQRWADDFRRYRVVKCQEQRSARGIRYEIEVRGKGEKTTNFYQYLFTEKGIFIDREKIELRPSDMTLY